MKIWIDDIQGYLDGYSTMEQPNKIELEVEKEPTDFLIIVEWYKFNIRS